MLFDSNRALADELRNRQIAKGLTSEEDVRNMHDIDLIKCYGECSRCGYLVHEEKLVDNKKLDNKLQHTLKKKKKKKNQNKEL